MPCSRVAWRVHECFEKHFGGTDYRARFRRCYDRTAAEAQARRLEPTSNFPTCACTTDLVRRAGRSLARSRDATSFVTLGWGCGAHDTRMRQPLSQPPPVGLDARRVSYVRQEEGSREDASPFPPLLSFLKLEYSVSLSGP